MGNIFSSEEKLFRHKKEEMIGGRNSRKTAGLYEQYGYHHPSNSFHRPYEPRYKKKRNISFHGRYGRSEDFRARSHSLNAILEELYFLGPEDIVEEGRRKINYETGGPLIPRIKLKRSTSSLNEDRSYKTLGKMASDSDIIIRGNSTNSSPSILLNHENNELNSKMPKTNISILLNDQSYEEISGKSDDSYFAKKFDDCMKRLQLIEKEHEMIENDDLNSEFPILKSDIESTQDRVETNKTSTAGVCNCKTECDARNLENELDESKLCENEIESETQNSEKIENQKNSIPKETVKAAEEEETIEDSTEPTSASWYANLKQQFEKREQENQEQKTKEMTCRITGATLKNQNEKNKSNEDKEKETRHYFSRLVKTHKNLPDEELPDPDKVKHIRAMFQESLNSTLKRRLDKKLGGSLQNISVRAAEQQMSRPLSAQCYRSDPFCEATNNQKLDEEKDKTTLTAERPLKDGHGELFIEKTKKKLLEKYEKDLKAGREHKSRKILQQKWTDTGSVSSGIGSDLSSYDTDLECYSREGTEQDETIISDDDLLEEVKDKHYVQNEVLEKIRSFGTSVTYYGGEMITCSIGPLLSPTTQAIIEEISEKYGHESTPAKSFKEFYQKYVESNEHERKKKLGRTRSFGQNDVFQKPNVLSNDEIEMYKNDLEIEIGIKKPTGIPQNSLKKKATKSASLGCNAEAIEKPKEKNSEPPIAAPESENPNTFKKEPSFENVKNDVINKDVTENDANDHSKANCQSETQNHIYNSGEKESELKTVEQEEEPRKTTFEKEPLFLRSKSAPEGFPIGQTLKHSSEVISKNEHPAKEIFFSYEKSIFNGKRNPDMEFEEFEVCESLSEKLEKLEKINPHERSAVSQEILSSAKIDDDELQKPFGDNSEEVTGVGVTTVEEENSKKKIQIDEVLTNDRETTVMGGNEILHFEKKDSKMNHSRWPIETSVMVDIQKNNEQTPKLITNGKTVAKTKIRLF